MLPKIAPVTAHIGKGRAISLSVRAPQLLLFYCAAFWLHQLIYRHLPNHDMFTSSFFSIRVLDKVIRNQKGTSYLIRPKKVQNTKSVWCILLLYWACVEFSVIFLYGTLDGVRQGIFQRVCELWRHRQSHARLHLYWHTVCGLRAANAIYSFQIVMMIVLRI